MRKLVRQLLALAAVMLWGVGTGCGGNLGPPSGELTRAVAFNIQWVSTSTAKGVRAAITRDTAPSIAPIDAYAAKITLPGADRNGNEVDIIAVRDTTAGAPAVQTYYPPVFIRVGSRTVSAAFFSDTSQQKKLAVINTSVNVTTAGGVLNLTTSQQPDKIVITPGQKVQVKNYKNEQPAKLDFTAFLGTGADQQVMAINPSNVIINITDGKNLVAIVSNPTELGNPNDSLQGLQSGLAAVTVQVGTTVSSATPVTIYSDTHVTIDKQQIGQNNDVTGNVPYTFQAAVTPPQDAIVQNIVLPNKTVHDSNLDVIWSIQEANQGTIHVDPNTPNTVQYTPPAKSGVYHLIATSVYDKGISAVAQVTVTLGALDISFQP